MGSSISRLLAKVKTTIVGFFKSSNLMIARMPERLVVLTLSNGDSVTVNLYDTGDVDKVALIYVHGNSCSLQSFKKQLESVPLTSQFRQIAFDLPGHGQSAWLDDPTKYSFGFFVEVLVALVAYLQLKSSLHRGFILVGHSLGGHVALESAPKLQAQGHSPLGIFIFGSPPLAGVASVGAALKQVAGGERFFSDQVSEADARATIAASFGQGDELVTAFTGFFMKTHPQFRSNFGKSLGGSETFTDEKAIALALDIPLALLHGEDDPLLETSYFESLAPITFWRGSIQHVPNAGHALQWDDAPEFNRLLMEFAQEVAA
jgi:pimeloyl-ACP methyl ester carboxylesterase